MPDSIRMRALRSFQHTTLGNVTEGEVFYPEPDHVAFYRENGLAILIDAPAPAPEPVSKPVPEREPTPDVADVVSALQATVQPQRRGRGRPRKVNAK